MKIFKIGEMPEGLYPTAGGKARGLDFMKRKGYRVPDGFIVTELGDGVDQAAIRAAFDGLGAERVSVRSSATDEDGEEYSGAGQYDTYLDVTADKLEEAVNACIRSLHGERAEVYGEGRAADGGKQMNLVVQRMADARFAGVAFTVSPTDGSKMLIEAVNGAGENLVSGVKTATQYFVPRSGFSCDGENCEIGEATLKSIYEQGLEISRLFGSEADLEWVVDGEGALYWLQLRPITVAAVDLDEFDSKNPLENHLLTTRNIGEMLPGAVTPLSISTSVLAIDYGMRNMLYKIGAIKRISDKPDYYLSLSVKNHLFIDMTALHGMSKKVAVASPPAMNLSIMGEFREDYPKVEGKNAFFITKLCNAVKFAKYIFSSEKAKANIVKLSDGLKIEEKDAPAEQYAEITAKLPAINEALCNHYVCSSYSGAMNSGLYMTLAKNFDSVQEYQSFVSSGLGDIDGVESADILAALTILGNEIKANRADYAEMTADDLLEYVSDPANGEAHALYAGFLKKHGHRSIKEAEMRSKAWKNDPVALMNNLRTVMNAGAAEEREAFDPKKFVDGYKGKGKGALKFLLPRARQAVVDREFSKSYIIKIIDKFKDAYARLAKQLTNAGLLADEDSIYFLTHGEIGALIEGDCSLKRKALARRAIFGEYEDMSFDDVCIGKPEPLAAQTGGGCGELKGIPVSRGKVYGRARIVRSAADAQKLQKGDIMVAPFTDIGWSPYYPLIGALVTEVGSALSHGAVVAREYCLPTVVNVKNATKLVSDGDYLCVDAIKGVVKKLDEEEIKKQKEK